MAAIQRHNPSTPRRYMQSRDPFGREFERMFNQMERMLSPYQMAPFWEEMDEGETRLMVPTDVHEKDDRVILSLDLPGVAKEDVNIEVMANVLTVSGERKSERESETGGVRRTERRYGRFEQSFTLPEGTDHDQIQARFENGVLQLSIPKSEALKPKKISVEEGKGGFFKRIIDKGKEVVGVGGEKEETAEEKRDEAKKAG